MDLQAFHQKVQHFAREEREEFLKNAPEHLRETLENIPMKVLMGDENTGLYGDYSGTPYPKENPFSAYSFPSDITLYTCGFIPYFEHHDEPGLRKKISKVIAHEYGHYLGFSEEELRRRGVF
ncbi:MAG: metallopeptidase family protein [bacterium]|nr:metallopeptidase family protein [bacterium]